MKKFLVYLLVIVVTVSLGFAIFYLVRDNEVISISTASLYQDAGDTFTIDLEHKNKKPSTSINITSSDSSVVSYNSGSNNFVANKGGVARINFRTTNAKFRNLWCDVIVGDGTEESPFYISTAEQLAAIGMGEPILDDNGNPTGVYAGAKGYEDYASDKYYKLVENIDVKSVNNGFWVPLRHFNGRIDGNGLTISNINIDKLGYTNAMSESNDYNPNLFSVENVGFVQSLGEKGAIYNVKFENFTAKGEYENFGSVAGLNYGHIERVEIKGATLNVETEVFGGIAAKNITTEGEEVVVNEDVEDGATEVAAAETETVYKRYIARIDRCSIVLNLGSENYVDNDGNTQTNYTYNSNIIGGLVGENNGGTIVYSYATGDVYFGKNSTSQTSNLKFGGITSTNTYISLTGFGGEYTTKYQGAHIKDCYSNLKVHTTSDVSNTSLIAGAIARNVDYSAEDYNDDTNIPIVQNYILGVYYNKDNLNFVEEGSNQTKSYKGIASFEYSSATISSKNIDFPDTKTIVYGYTTDDMRISSNFVSHTTKDVRFDEEGNSRGIVEEEVLWLFDTVWAMDSNTNDGMPYLNYQLVYIPDDFGTAGVPVMENKVTYKFIVDVEYAISILSALDGKLYITVGEEYNLKIDPYNAQVNWQSGDENIVTVDANGKIKGKNVGSTSITAVTRHGSSATITVFVEEISYSISNYPSKVIVNQGESETVTGIKVTPCNDLTYLMQVKDGDGNPKFAKVEVIKTNTTSSYTEYSLKVTGLEGGYNRVFLIAGRTMVSVDIDVIAKQETPTSKVFTITSNPTSISGEFGRVANGTIKNTVKVDGVAYNGAVSYTAKSSNNDVIKLTSESSTNGTFSYTIQGAGTAVISIYATATNGSVSYSGISYIQVNITPANTPEIPEVTEELTVNYSTVYLTEGKTIQLVTSVNTGKKVYFQSLNTNIATVSNTGLVTAISANYNGSNTTNIKIYFQKDNGTIVYTYCKVVVREASTPTSYSISLDKSSVTCNSGDVIKIKAIASHAGYITWTKTGSTDGVVFTIIDKDDTLEIKTNGFSGSFIVTAKYSVESNSPIVCSASASITVNPVTDDTQSGYSKYIYNYSQLNAVRNNLSRDFILCADIDMTGKTWTPIGTVNNPFTGTFKAQAKNGGGYYSIYNMTTKDVECSGLFGYIKGANIQNVAVRNSEVKGEYAGAIAGYANSSKIYNCSSIGNTITSCYVAGGIVGAALSNSTIDSCLIKSNSTNSSVVKVINNSNITGVRHIGGIVGYLNSSTVTTVKSYDTSVQVASGIKANAGGIAGYANSQISNAEVTYVTITNNTNSDDNFSGGIVGYGRGKIISGSVQHTTIQGYFSGAIGGALLYNATFTVKFSETKKGYRREDISSSNYHAVVTKIAVYSSTTVKGEIVGGLFGAITSGVVNNCFTHAKLQGISSSSIKGGFAAFIYSSGFNNAGGTGNVGIVEYCYSACSFSGSGDNYSITASLVHNYSSFGDDTRNAGYVFNYVFDNDVDGSATYYCGSNLFSDHVKAKKSSSEMKTQSTYTNKGFSTSIWNFSSGYPTLK